MHVPLWYTILLAKKHLYFIEIVLESLKDQQLFATRYRLSCPTVRRRRLRRLAEAHIRSLSFTETYTPIHTRSEHTTSTHARSLSRSTHTHAVG